jgi:carbonic anhydrase/acetyltransferase-like protein (isoleucine patch superfamily)
LALTDKQQKLLEELRELHYALRSETRQQYQRINPFYEDLFDWRERGAFWCDEDRNVTIYNSATVLGDVDIGRDTWIGPFCLIDGTAGIRIGKNCSIALGSQILTHDTIEWALTGGKRPYQFAPVSIGDNCFLGTLSIVVKGVTIGSRCLIGAGTLVNRDVPENSIVMGLPGRVVGTVEISHNNCVNLNYF